MTWKWLPVLALLAGSLKAEPLSLDSYLAQVKQGSPALAAARAQDAALKLAALEPEVMLSPYLNGSAQYYDDQAEPAIPFSPQRTIVTQAEGGLSKQFGFSGSKLNLGYKFSNQSILLPPGLFGPGSDPFQLLSNGVSVSLQQPLLKDFGARGYRIAQRKADAATGSAGYMNQWGAQATLFEAEASYVGLASMRQVLALLQESSERNKKILEWTEQKYADNLADKVDVLQVKAAVQQVQAGILATQQEAARLGEKFNVLRGLSPTAEVAELSGVEAPASLPGPPTEPRLDLKAAEENLKGAQALVDDVRERFIPELNVFGSAMGTGADRPQPGESWNFDHPTYVVGLKFTSTLDLPLYLKVIKGARQALNGGEEDLALKRLKVEQEWKALKGSWENLQEQLALAKELEAVQKEKAEREKRRYLDGRTTNFQVLRFDEDYNQARIQTLRLTAQAAVLAAQARFYQGGQTWQ